MARERIWTLIWSEELKSQVPLPDTCKQTIENTKQEIEQVLAWTSDKKIMIIWPCSADFEDSLVEYGKKLKQMKEKYGEKIIFVMRFYTGKPRTIGGWKWIQQWPIDSSETSTHWQDIGMNDGLLYSRKLAIKLMEETWIALADEMLHPQLYDHFDDIFAYQAIGARSTENQYHREVSSGTDIAIGLKNPTGGNLQIMVNSILAAQTKSTFTIWESIYLSTGNNLAHGILRGWDNWPNYSLKHIQEAYVLMKKWGVKNPKIIIDCSHENCKIDGKKDPLQQIQVMNSVMESIENDSELKNFVAGFMVESYIYDGQQSMPKDEKDIPQAIAEGKLIRWKSLTDPCIWVEKTGDLLVALHSKI